MGWLAVFLGWLREAGVMILGLWDLWLLTMVAGVFFWVLAGRGWCGFVGFYIFWLAFTLLIDHYVRRGDFGHARDILGYMGKPTHLQFEVLLAGLGLAVCYRERRGKR